MKKSYGIGSEKWTFGFDITGFVEEYGLAMYALYADGHREDISGGF